LITVKGGDARRIVNLIFAFDECNYFPLCHIPTCLHPSLCWYSFRLCSHGVMTKLS